MAKTTKASTAKTKKISAYESACLFINLCAIATLVFTFAIIAIGNIVGPGDAVAAVCQPVMSVPTGEPSVTDALESPTVLYPVTASAPNEGAIKITVNDGGYLQKKLVLTPEVPTYLEITNKGVNDHSFVIDELGVDSGVIKPGETRAISLPSLENKAQNYVFYSNLAGDGNEVFSGEFIIEEYFK